AWAPRPIAVVAPLANGPPALADDADSSRAEPARLRAKSASGRELPDRHRTLPKRAGAAGIGPRILADRGGAAAVGLCTVAERGAVAVIGQRALADGCRVRGIRTGGVPERGGVRLACSGPGLRMTADRGRAVVGGGAAGIRKRADRG